MNFIKYICAIVVLCSIWSCSHKDSTNNTNVLPPLTASTPVKGYNLLAKICGIWDGPVASSTMLGSYPEWIVDFRPISGGQVSAKNELDTVNDIFMSFFIIYDSTEYKLAFRNGGSFAGMKRVSYMLIDSVSETSQQSYYRFVDFVKGSKRMYSEVIFHSDSLIIRSFTNKYNTLSTPVMHMDWHAALQDTTSYQPAKTALNFPQKVLVKNFSTTFSGMTESILYSLTGDPYPESAQPYLGQSALSYTVASNLPAMDTTKTVLLVVTTQPLISGFTVDYAAMNDRSRYVILSSKKSTYTFNYMHPGSYYLYAIYDADGNRTLSRGDYVSTTNAPFTLAPLGTASQTTQMNYQIP